MTKLLILSSDTGEGHNSAASALELAASNAGLEVSIRKPLEESGSVNRSMGKLYNALLARRPQWMNRYFWLIDHFRPNERDIFYTKAREFIGPFLDSDVAHLLAAGAVRDLGGIGLQHSFEHRDLHLFAA